MDPYLSIVIPTWNRADTLLRVLGSLGRQIDAPSFEVIIVNDGSTDDTAELISRALAERLFPYPIRFESQENSGPGKARNRGTSMAEGTYVLYIGDDTVPDPRFLSEHASVHQQAGDDPLLACLGYTGWPEEESASAFMDYINEYGLQFGYALIEHGAIVPFNFFYTSNISVARAVLGPEPFDTTFPAAAWEDIELAYRLERDGLRIRYNANAVTRHYHRMTVDSFARRQYGVGRSGAIFFQKHPELGHFLGVHELRNRPQASRGELFRLRLAALAGERFRTLARPAVFEKLMREHYLRGLERGLEELKAPGQT